MRTFGFNGNGGLNTRVSNLERAVFEFGLQWNQTTDTYARLENAVGLSVDNSSSPHQSGFSDFLPWSGIRRCNLASDGTVNAYYGDSTYADDGTNGNVMVQIPKFYYKTIYDTTTDNVWRWYVSGYKLPTYEVHPAFVDNGIEKDFIYVGAYNAFNSSGTLQSKSGVAPTVNQAIGTFRTQAQANGSGWGLFDWTSLSAVQLLYLVEYGSMYSQSVLSVGVTDYTVAVDSGKTISLGNGSGEVDFDTTQVVSYRGIENFYGNVWQFIDGILIKDDGYYIGESIDDYTNAGTSYTHVPAVPITTDGYGTNFEYLSNFKHSFMANAVGGANNTHLTDYLYAHDSTEVNIAIFGGYWNYGAHAGAFTLSLADVASIAISSLGTRVCYK